MAVTLVCYAAGPRNHERNRLALIVSAKNKGIDRIIAYDPLDGSHPFYQQHRHILERPTGAGFWLWKPYIIAETLKHLGPDEIVFYLDSDARANPLEPAARGAGSPRSAALRECPLEPAVHQARLLPFDGCRRSVLSPQRPA